MPKTTQGKRDVKHLSDVGEAISRLALRQLELEREVATLAADLEQKTKELNQFRRELLPAALKEAGVKEQVLASGHRVKLSDDITCSLTGKYREKAITWLRKIGRDDLVSFTVLESFASSNERELQKLRNFMAKNKIPFVEGETTPNTGTFKALVRERLANGESVPLSQLGIIEISSVNITPPTNRGGRR